MREYSCCDCLAKCLGMCFALPLVAFVLAKYVFAIWVPIYISRNKEELQTIKFEYESYEEVGD